MRSEEKQKIKNFLKTNDLRRRPAFTWVAKGGYQVLKEQLQTHQKAKDWPNAFFFPSDMLLSAWGIIEDLTDLGKGGYVSSTI